MSVDVAMKNEIPKQEVNHEEESVDAELTSSKRLLRLNLDRTSRDMFWFILFGLTYLFFLIGPMVKIHFMDKTPLSKLASYLFPSIFLRDLCIFSCVLLFYTVMTLYCIPEILVLSSLVAAGWFGITIYLKITFNLDWTVLITPIAIPCAYAIYCFLFRNSLNLSLKTFRCSAAVLKTNFHLVLLVAFVGLVLYVPLFLSLIACCVDIQSNKLNSVFIVGIGIFEFWYANTLKMVVDLFISSLIYNRIYGVKNYRFEAFKTTIRGIGTCCCAGFIEGIFDCLRAMFRNWSNRTSWFSAGIMQKLLGMLLRGLLDLLMVFMDIYHKFIVGFVALNNVSYFGGAKLVYYNISKFKAYPLSNYLMYGLLVKSLELFSSFIAFSIICYQIWKLDIEKLINMDVIQIFGLVQSILSPISLLFLIKFIYNKLFSGSMAVLLLYFVDRKTCDIQFPDFALDKEI